MSFSSDNPLQANQLAVSLDVPRDPERQLEMISEQFKRISSSVNSKIGSLYIPTENANFVQYFTPNNPQVLRNGYRQVVNFGVLPASGTKDVLHGIAFTSAFSLTQLYGAATDPNTLTYIPLPFAGANPANSVELYADGTKVYISTGGTSRSNYTTCYVVIEYLKN